MCFLIVLMKTALEPLSVFVNLNVGQFSVIVKGTTSEWQDSGLKHKDPKHRLFPSLVSHSTAEHSGNVSKEWEI